jgi:integrase/recombinase XerD
MAQSANTHRPNQSKQLTLIQLLNEHLTALRVKGYSLYTVRNRLVHIRMFLRWCADNQIGSVSKITLKVLEGYQRHIAEYRKPNGQPLTIISQHARLVPLRVWFRWMAKQRYLRTNPASDLELPRLGRILPRNILSAEEVERVLRQPCLTTAIGLRDRAILEVFYSTGIRRLELVRLKIADLHFDRGLLLVREGKGGRDRYVPIGQRAVQWLRKYLRRSRPGLSCCRDEDTAFVSREGKPISRDQLSWIARKYVTAAKLGKTGSCHLFRHTMATLMHENGADIRFVQQMLGHADIKTTQIYTQVAIPALQRVHAQTHPAG